jgi:hypothetical protein
MADCVIEVAGAPLGEEWAGMTFPLYRPLLAALDGGEGVVPGGRPIAVTARTLEGPGGLVLARLSETGEPTAELLSVLVGTALRNQGLATALLSALDAELVRRKVTTLTAVYMTGSPSIPALERVLAKCGFSPPECRKIVVKFTPEEASRTEWYRKAKLPPGSSIFPWTELSDADRDHLKQSQAERAWIHPELEPWRCDQHFDTVSSVGLRKSGEVVGWVINHRVRPDLVAFTTSFVRYDLQRRGAIFPLYVASLERLRGTGVMCSLVTSSQFESMRQFVLRRCAPFVTFCGETRGVSKRLPGGETATGSPA